MDTTSDRYSGSYKKHQIELMHNNILQKLPLKVSLQGVSGWTMVYAVR